MRFMLRCARDTLAILPRSSRIQAIPYDIPHDAPHDSRHRLHPRGARGRGPRSPVHGARRLGRPVPSGADAAEKAHAGDRGARGRRRLHGRRLCPRQRPLRRGARHRRPRLLQHGNRGCRAKTDGSPVLVMTGEVPLDLEDRGAFQDASQATLDDTAVMASLTRLSKTVATANNLNHWFRHALTTMWAQPRGPVHLSLTHDALVGQSAADYAQVAGFFAQAQPLSAEAAETALKLLANRDGSTIAVLAGAGVEHDAAAARLKEIAERWSIPVATTLRAKGVFPEDHALSIGVFGLACHHAATAAILGGELDCLLVLGSGFNAPCIGPCASVRRR